MQFKKFTLIVLMALSCLNCSNEITNSSVSSANDPLVFDENGIPTNCQRWFDGCNTCETTEFGAFCTRMACPPDEVSEPVCLDANPQNQFELETN